MRITTTTSEFKAALARFAGTIPARPALPALACLLVKGKEDGSGVTMTGTDTDISIVADMKCVVECPEAIAIPYRLLSALVDAAAAGIVTLDTEGDSVVVRTATGTSRISTINPSFFPPVSFPDVMRKITLPCDVLESMLARVSFASATPEQVRKTLENTLIEAKDGKVRAVATNGLAMAIASLPVGLIDDKFPQILIPLKSRTIIRKLLTEDKVSLCVPDDASCAMFVMEDTVVKTKLCTDRYPNYRQVIPDISSPLYSVSVSRNEAISSIRRTALLSTLGDNVYTRCNFGPKEIVFSSQATGVGDTREVVVPSCFEGKETSACFNPSLLVSALSSASCDIVNIVQAKPIGPIVVKDEKNYMALLMPIRES